MSDLKDKTIDYLRKVFDPEIPLNIYDLGLIYDVATDDKTVNITMSLTSPFCPAADDIVNDVHQACYLAGADKANVDITFDPQWGPEHISEEGKLILGLWDD